MMFANGQAKSALGQVSDKAGEKTPDVNVPGFGPFKFNPKEDAKQAQKKSPLGYMQVSTQLFNMQGSIFPRPTPCPCYPI